MTKTSALILLSAASLPAATIITSHDGFIREGQATVVQDGGTGVDLALRSDNSANNDNVRKVYFKFDLSGFNADLNSSATFTTTISSRSANQNGNRAFYFYGLNAGFTATGGELGSDWTETALTWNNAPGNDRTTNVDSGFNPATTTLIQTNDNQYNSNVGKVYTITIANLGDFVQADNTVTLMASWSDTTEYAFASRENTTVAYHPSLEFNTIPEPTTLVSALVGGLLGLRRRR
ncbi:MAG: DNRLRE domain-containing protein [Verrucomicrobiales bacterium]